MSDSGAKELGGEYLPFHPDLDEKFPIDRLLRQDNLEAVISGQIKPLTWVSVFRNSPLRSAEAEMIMGKLVTAAVRTGQWLSPTEKLLEFMAERLEPYGFNDGGS